MKIRKLLKNLDTYAYIKILEYVGPEDWEVLWKGEVYNCPVGDGRGGCRYR